MIPHSKIIVILAVILVLVPSSRQREVSKKEKANQKRVVCYYTNWSVYRPGTAKYTPQNINPYLCTHLIYAFGGLDRENGLRPYDKYQDIEQGGYARFNGLKTYNKGLKTLLAVGGWNEGSTRFSPLVADSERRQKFVKNVLKFLRQNNFDGLDLDWEYPAFRDGGQPRDRDNYAQLVQELREEFERESSKTGRTRLLLTMAVPAGIEYIDKGYDVTKLNRYLDFMNLLTYDYHSAFEPSVNHHSPLYSLEEDSEYNFDGNLNIDATVKHYIMKGADPNKLVLGIPTYGRSYTLFNPESNDLGAPSDGPGEQGFATREKGYLAYYEICANLKGEGWIVEQPKPTAMGPYAFSGNQWVGYDDEAIVKKKASYVNENNLGGIMFWSIDNDDFRGTCHNRAYPLIEAGKEALLGIKKNNGTSANKVTPEGRVNKLGFNKGKLRVSTTTTVRTTTPVHITPEPPTTPDPGSDFTCKEEGFFPHPRDCKKYFWCLDSGPSNLGIVAHQFTCPSGLYFNKAADSCDFSRNVLCNKKKVTTTTTFAPVTKSATKVTPSQTTRFTTTTTTTTTTEAPIEEEEEDEDYREEQSEEDPETIKQLIALIKKLGGVAELEKQLEATSGSDSTAPPISKSLYDRVISNRTNRLPSYQNAPARPQYQGSSNYKDTSGRRFTPQYVNIRRPRPPKVKVEDEEEPEIEIEDDIIDEEHEEVTSRRPFRHSPVGSRGSQTSGLPSTTERPQPVYQSVNRFRVRPSGSGPVTQAPGASRTSTLRYVTVRRDRTEPKIEEEYIERDELVTEEIDFPTTTVATTTVTPRIKITNRIRRPLERIQVSRSTTTSTTPKPTTTSRPSSPILRQRYNRLKTVRKTLQPTTTTENIKLYEEEEEPILTTSLSPARKDIHFEDRSFPSDDSKLIENQSVTQRVVTPDIPDLANVAIAAIQSLATSPPASAPLRNKEPSITTTEKIEVITSSPRPFSRGPSRVQSKVQPQQSLSSSVRERQKITERPTKRRLETHHRPKTTSARPQKPAPVKQIPIYDDYSDDYYAEPIDVPLSGKVRIHTDGYIECLDVGNFPHPFSCRKFISCAKMENGHLLGWEYTCPKGLSFDPIGSICNWNAGLGCKE